MTESSTDDVDTDFSDEFSSSDEENIPVEDTRPRLDTKVLDEAARPVSQVGIQPMNSFTRERMPTPDETTASHSEIASLEVQVHARQESLDPRLHHPIHTGSIDFLPPPSPTLMMPDNQTTEAEQTGFASHAQSADEPLPPAPDEPSGFNENPYAAARQSFIFRKPEPEPQPEPPLTNHISTPSFTQYRPDDDDTKSLASSSQETILYVAVFAYAGIGQEQDLLFDEGEPILVSMKGENGWWGGSIGQRVGWFPSQYGLHLRILFLCIV